jgi:hypothetical protein
MYELIAIFAVFVFLYSITAGGISRTAISGAIVFTAFGLLFGPFGLRLLDLDVGPNSRPPVNDAMKPLPPRYWANAKQPTASATTGS